MRVYAIPPIDADWELLGRARIADVPVEGRRRAMDLGWEGDVRDDLIGRFLIPVEDGFAVGFIWKQENNGTCFIVSPVSLPHLEE